jgi:tRNA A-37 threonylcarbamoyl transferase component Bud32
MRRRRDERTMSDSWHEPRELRDLRSGELGVAGVVFAHAGDLYRTVGRHLARGGMGDIYLLERRAAGSTAVDAAVGKVFHREYLYQLRTDEVTRRDHERNLRVMRRIAAMGHPNLLPTYVSEPIADNHLLVAPRKEQTLLGYIAQGGASGGRSVRARVALLLQAMQGLDALHAAGIIHRDFTLRNILVAGDPPAALLFDFDLALALDELDGESYRAHYRGRIFGSPGYSVAPEILDPALMECPISPRLDVYAIGGALFGLFTDALPYGETEDMWGLLLRIAEGVVYAGASRIAYGEGVPRQLRPIIDRCLERDPALRLDGVAAVAGAIAAVFDELPDDHASPGLAHGLRARHTLRYGHTIGDVTARLREVYGARRDPSVTLASIEAADAALGRLGYQIERSLGRVKGHPIYVAAPVPILVASGEFPDANTYPKIVTALDLSGVEDPERFLDLWLGGFLPILRGVRQGLMTALFRAVHDPASQHLFLFSEYVDDARFGTDIADMTLSIEEALGLGYLVAHQVRQLHRAGVAHNNVHAGSLLLKGIRDGRRVQPAMIGLVDPSFAPEARASDVQQLAALVLDWLPTERGSVRETSAQAAVARLAARLAHVAGVAGVTPTADQLLGEIASGLSAVDKNFGVLAAHGGDLSAYASLLVQHRLYGRLW